MCLLEYLLSSKDNNTVCKMLLNVDLGKNL
jgi:hypothetical protein